MTGWGKALIRKANKRLSPVFYPEVDGVSFLGSRRGFCPCSLQEINGRNYADTGKVGNRSRIDQQQSAGNQQNALPKLAIRLKEARGAGSKTNHADKRRHNRLDCHEDSLQPL